MQDIGEQGLGKQGPGHLEREGAEGALMGAAGSFQKGGLGTRLAVPPEAPPWPAGVSGSPRSLFQGLPREAGVCGDASRNWLELEAPTALGSGVSSGVEGGLSGLNKHAGAVAWAPLLETPSLQRGRGGSGKDLESKRGALRSEELGGRGAQELVSVLACAWWWGHTEERQEERKR